MIIVTGLRRIGKSSLVLAGLNSLNRGYTFVDVRKIYDSVSKRITPDKLYEEIHSSLIKISKMYHLKDILKRFHISLEYPIRISKKEENVEKDLANMFSALNEIGLNNKPIPIVFDEAQYLRFSTVGLKPLLAHIYDYMKGLVLIFTGSEVGLLEDFLGVDDAKSELYGRYYCSIELKPFDEEKSKEFLKKGFEEFNVKVEDSLVNEAVNELDGIVGWLVYFGKLYLEKRRSDVIREVKELGSRLVREELRELVTKTDLLLTLKGEGSLRAVHTFVVYRLHFHHFIASGIYPPRSVRPAVDHGLGLQPITPIPHQELPSALGSWGLGDM
ncbi:AAA family ATPase [Saccharolobus shibatae]|uniref:ATPase domain-containing protein n=1 Tax=Saccharolobus shibatae TaxID=2286 RepID=A0A8F5H0C9_9CREN|nr:ATP-binding protein [Saccharolobus shibatae]QXJ35477.1 hypothetical protein J5U22_02024 [Saccharolobus shibatae]